MPAVMSLKVDPGSYASLTQKLRHMRFQYATCSSPGSDAT